MKLTAVLIVLYIAFLAISGFQLRRAAENSAKLEYAIDYTRKLTRGEVVGGATRTEQMFRAMEQVRSEAGEQSKLYVWLAVGLTLPVALSLAREFERRKMPNHFPLPTRSAAD